MWDAEAKMDEVEKKKTEVESKLGRANFDVKRLRKELHEIEC